MHSNHDTTRPADGAAPRVIEIELLALDLTSCTRCVGSLHNIERAISIVRQVAEVTGAQVNVTKQLIETEEQALRYRFVSSPTVRINGRDIVFETLESQCDSCTDLCGCDEGTSCRIWSYQGKEYTEAPVGLIVEALLREMVDGARAATGPSANEEVPENLRRFFSGKAAKQHLENDACCSSAEQETCCVPEQRSGCCDADQPAACGCR